MHLCTSCFNQSLVCFLLNVPIRKLILTVIATVAKFSLIHRDMGPGIVTNMVLQDSNDVIIHQKVIESVVPNYVISTTEVFMNILSDLLGNRLFTFVVTFHQMPVKPFCSFFEVFENEWSNWIVITLFH